MNAITYKEVFPLLKDNVIWLGYKSLNQDMYFDVPEERRQWLVEHKKEGSAYKIIGGVVKGRLASACWFTNLDHGKRHELLLLDTMEHNLKFNKKLRKKLEKDYGAIDYPHYDNYDALYVPFVESIPSDFDGVMGVPITFLDKYNPEQFEIISMSRNAPGYTGMRKEFLDDYFAQGGTGSMQPGHPDLGYYTADGRAIVPYRRILIRAKKEGSAR